MIETKTSDIMQGNDQIVELSATEIVEISGGINDGEPTVRDECALCIPRQQCRIAFWCR